MGWKASTIVIKKPDQVDQEELLKELGFTDLKKSEDEPFEVAINPDDNKVYIGYYNDNLLICAPDLPLEFFKENQSKVEKILIRKFPNSEICSLVLHSGVNLWGYSIINNGGKIRSRAGSSEDGTFVDFGEPLNEELELLSKSSINKKGKRIYILDEFDDEPLSEDQVGENFVFSISKRYFEKELDRADDLLFETKLTGYSFKNDKKNPIPKAKQRKIIWVQFLLIILLLVIWQILKIYVFKT